MADTEVYKPTSEKSSKTGKNKAERWKKGKEGSIISNKEIKLLSEAIEEIKNKPLEKEYFQAVIIRQEGIRIIRKLFNERKISEVDQEKLNKVQNSFFDFATRKLTNKLSSKQIEKITNVVIRAEQVAYQEEMIRAKDLSEFKTIINEYGAIKGSRQIFKVAELKIIIDQIANNKKGANTATSALGFRKSLLSILKNKHRERKI